VTAKKNVVKVSILGEDFSLRSETTPEETLAVAEYLDRVIKQLMDSGSVTDPRKAAILAGLRITGELFEARDASERSVEGMHALAEEIRPLLPPAKR
jgi:cell division protein ZapA